MNKDRIRVGIVGAGRNTTLKHIPKLQAIDDVNIVSVCNRSRESSERVAQRFNIPKVYDHWLELVEETNTNAIVIGTWPYMHCPITLAALAANKHVMCEARMAMNAREAHAMLDAARSKPHLVTQVVPALTRADKMAKRLIAEGYVGDVLAIDVRENIGFIDHKAPLHWRQDFDLSGFNMMVLGLRYEVVLRWVGEATRVIAMGKTRVKMRLDPQTGIMRAIRIPDHLDVIADMACGAQAHFGLSQVTGLPPDNGISIYGSEGTLCFSGNKLYGGRRGDTALDEIVIPADEEGVWRVEEEFVSAIRGNEAITHTTFEDGVKYMEFTEAVARSVAEGRSIALPL
jgi:predicted dehydrogenase